MTSFTALFDACVLYRAPVRDLLMRCALTDLFRPKWSEQINEEWIESLLANRPDLTRSKLERTRKLMNRHTRDALVSGHEYLIETIELPDKNDEHVLAAAIHAKADVIVTYNLKDFPEATLSKHNLEAQHPDTFLTHLIDLNHPGICSAVKRVIQSLNNPPLSVDEYLQVLEAHELTQFAAELRDYKELLK